MLFSICLVISLLYTSRWLIHFLCSALQDLQPIDRFVVEEYLLDVLFFLNGWLVDGLIFLDIFTVFSTGVVFAFLWTTLFDVAANIVNSDIN